MRPRPWRTLTRALFFPVILLIGVILGLVAIVLHPQDVFRGLRQRRSVLLAGSSPEERKTIRHFLAGLAYLAVLVALVLLIVLAAR